MEKPTLARRFVSFGIKASQGLPLAPIAQAHRLLGHISLELGRPRAALLAYSKALNTVLELTSADPPSTAMIAAGDILNCIACCLLEIDNFAAALQTISWSASIHNAHNPDGMPRTHAVRALAYLQTNQPLCAKDEFSKFQEMQDPPWQDILDTPHPRTSATARWLLMDIAESATVVEDMRPHLARALWVMFIAKEPVSEGGMRAEKKGE